jgi:hypothetical protein
MKIEEMVLRATDIVNELSEAIENRRIGLKEVEERILEFVNRIGVTSHCKWPTFRTQFWTTHYFVSCSLGDQNSSWPLISE